MSTELLGLAAARVGDEEGFVVLDEEFLKLALDGLVVVLLGVSDDTLGDGLADGQNLRGRTTTSDANANVESLKARCAQKKDGLQNLQSHGGGLHNVQRLSIDTNISAAFSDGGDSGGVLLPSESLNQFVLLLS